MTELDYQIEVFHDGEWRPLYGTDTDGVSQTSVPPGEYVSLLSKICPTALVRVAKHIEELQ